MKFEKYIQMRDDIFNIQDANKECLNINWGALSLGGEVGEVQNIVKKIKRDDGGVITAEKEEKLFDELGDVLWYWVFCCDILGFNPHKIMEYNMDKLKKRYGIK